MKKLVRAFLNLPIIRYTVKPLVVLIIWTPGAIAYAAGFRKEVYMMRLLSGKPTGLVEASFRSFFLDFLFYLNVPKNRTGIVGNHEAGDTWCDLYHDRVDHDTREVARNREMDWISTVASSVGATSILQVGCAGGADLWALLPKVESSVTLCGVDLNEHTLEQNTERFSSQTNMKFMAADILTSDILEEVRPDLVFTCGTAEYFVEEELDTFIRKVESCGAKALAFIEPVDLSIFRFKNAERSTRRGRMAFNHSYQVKLKSHGLKIEELTVYDPEASVSVAILYCAGYFA